MRCNNCNIDLPEGSKFCLECGAEIKKKEENFIVNNSKEETKKAKLISEDTDSKVLFKKGYELHIEGNFEEALKIYNKVVEEFPNSIEAQKCQELCEKLYAMEKIEEDANEFLDQNETKENYYYKSNNNKNIIYIFSLV